MFWQGILLWICLMFSWRSRRIGDDVVNAHQAHAFVTTLKSKDLSQSHFGRLEASSSSSYDTEQIESSQCPLWLKEASSPVSTSAVLSSELVSRKKNAQDWTSYHLIWSPGAWKKIVVSFLTMSAVHAGYAALASSTIWQSRLTLSNNPLATSWLVRPLGTFLSQVVLPLLASACCMIQLWINLLAGGCAGFNTYLGPIRPYFLSLLFYLTVLNPNKSRTIGSFGVFGLRWAVALLPEMLHLVNDFLEKRKAGDTSTASAPLPWKATVQLEIPTMGCVACINTIDQSLRRAVTSTQNTKNDDGQQRQPPQVLEAASFLHPLGRKGGYAKVRVAIESPQQVHAVVQSLLRAVDQAGFAEAHVTSSEVSPNVAKF